MQPVNDAQSPPWFRLLRHHQAEGYGFALTLPFLIGALRVPVGRCLPDPDWNFADFKQHLHEIRDQGQEEFKVRIAHCDVLHEPVIALICNPQDWCAPWPAQAAEDASLYVSREYLPNNEPVENAPDFLWGLVGQYVIAGKFSFDRRMGTYRNFDADDRKFVSDAFTRVEQRNDLWAL